MEPVTENGLRAVALTDSEFAGRLDIRRKAQIGQGKATDHKVEVDRTLAWCEARLGVGAGGNDRQPCSFSWPSIGANAA